MSSLTKRRKNYYSRIQVRVGNPKDNKRKIVYIKLDTQTYSFAKKRNAIVTKEENKIRVEIRQGLATKSDLLTINDNSDWELLKNSYPNSFNIVVILCHTYHNLIINHYHYQGIYVYILNMKKPQRLSVRTTKQNEDWLKGLMKKTDRSVSYLISKMIDVFREKGIDDERDIK